MVRRLLLVLALAAPALAAERGPAAGRPGPAGPPSIERVISALPAQERLSVLAAGYLFSGRDFIYAGSSSTLFGGVLSADWALLEAVDAFLSVGASTASNTKATPSSLSSGTELGLGARGRIRLGPLHVGAVAVLRWSAPGPTAPGSGLGASGSALASVDLRDFSLPLALHANVGYRSDPSLVRQRLGVFPGFAQSLWRYDVATLGGAVEAPLGRVAPFVECSLDVPLGSPAPVAAFPSRITPGVSVEITESFSVRGAVEVALSTAVQEGVPTAAPYLARLSLSYSPLGRAPWSSAKRAGVSSAVASPPPKLDREPLKVGRLVIRVVIKGADTPLAGATVKLGDATASTDEQGIARFGELPPGPIGIAVTVDGYKPGSEGAIVVADQEWEVTVGMVEAKKRAFATIDGLVRSTAGGKPVSAELEILEAKLKTRTNAAGAFSFHLRGGTYTVEISAPDYLTQSKSVTVTDGDQATFNVDLHPK